MLRLSRQESQLLTRAKLRTAARREFADRGVGAASIDRISEAAGFSRGAFYKNYAGKRELLLEMINEINEAEIGIWRSLIEGADDLTLLLPDLERQFNAYAANRDQWLLGAELQMEAVRDPEFGLIYRQHAQAVLEQLRQVMALLLAKAGSRADPAKLALALRALTFGLMFADGNGEVVEGHAPGEAVTLLLRSVLGAPEASRP